MYCIAEDNGKGKLPLGAFLVTRFPMPQLGAKPWHYAAELCTPSVTYPLCSSAFADTMDNLSEMCPLKLTVS